VVALVGAVFLGNVTAATAAPVVIGNPIPVGSYPSGVAVNETTNRVYVANYGSDSVSVIDGASGNVIGTSIPVGDGPRGVAVNEAANRVYVTNHLSHSVSVIDGASGSGNAIGTSIPVGDGPSGVAVNETTNRVYVANVRGLSVSVIDGATGVLIGSLVPVGDVPSGVAVNETTNRVYVANYIGDSVSVIDGASGNAIGTSIPVGDGPRGVAVNEATNRVYVENREYYGYVSIIDGATGALISRNIAAGSFPIGVAVNEATNRVYVADAGSDSVTVVEEGALMLTTPAAPATMYVAKALVLDGALKPKHPAGTYPVRIYRWRLKGAWIGYGDVKAQASDYSTYTKYAAAVTFPSTGFWRVRAYAPATAAHPAMWSPNFDYITVRDVWVSVPNAPERMRDDTRYSVTGSLKMRHISGTRPVRIYKWKKLCNGAWDRRGYTLATVQEYRTYSRYRARMSFSSPGKWRVRAYHPESADDRARWSSGYDYVTVTR